jgi:hypothetical protein
MQTRKQTNKHPSTLTHKHTSTQTHKHATCKHTRTHAHKHTNTQACTHTSKQANKHTNTQAYKHVNTQARNVQTHTHINTQTRKHTSTQIANTQTHVDRCRHSGTGRHAGRVIYPHLCPRPISTLYPHYHPRPVTILAPSQLSQHPYPSLRTFVPSIPSPHPSPRPISTSSTLAPTLYPFPPSPLTRSYPRPIHPLTPSLRSPYLQHPRTGFIPIPTLTSHPFLPSPHASLLSPNPSPRCISTMILPPAPLHRLYTHYAQSSTSHPRIISTIALSMSSPHLYSHLNSIITHIIPYLATLTSP